MTGISAIRAQALSLALLLASSAVSAARLSPCQGHFDAVRGSAYSFTLQTPDFAPPPALAAELEQAAEGLYQSWAFLLSAPPPFAAQLDLTLVAEGATFRHLQETLVPGLPQVDGFYAGQPNRAVARWYPSEPLRSRRAALHELAHQLTVSQIGAAPGWLAEGLAEFFEMLVPGEEGWQVAVNPRHHTQLAGLAAPALENLFDDSPDDWHQHNSRSRYALAWSLVQFLMESATGRGALGQVLQQAGTHSCTVYRAQDFLHHAYPGGLPALEQAWQAWLAKGQFTAVTLPQIKT